jgi:HK97 family phage portal protein
MTLRQRIAQYILGGAQPQLVKQTMPDGKSWVWHVNWGWGGRLPANSSTFINDGYAGNSDVYSIISYALRASSSLQWKAYKEVRGEDVELDKYHPVSRMLKYASPVQPFSEFVQAWLGYKLLLGNSYTMFLKPEFGVNAGKPVQMTVLPSQLMEVFLIQATGEVKEYVFNQSAHLAPEQVAHSKSWNPQVQQGGEVYGLSPLTAGLRLLNMSNSGYDGGAASLKNGGVKGILTAHSEDQWGKEEIDRIRDKFNEDYMGADNYGKMVVAAAQMDYHQIGISPADLELMQALRLTKQQLCSLYGFPSQLLNDKEGSLYNTYREAKKVFYTDMLLPELYQLEEVLNKWVADPYGSDIKIKIETSDIEVLMDNKVEQAQWLSQAWWIKAIDKQRLMGMPEDPEMDDYFIPSGLMPMKEISGMDAEIMP